MRETTENTDEHDFICSLADATPHLSLPPGLSGGHGLPARSTSVLSVFSVVLIIGNQTEPQSTRNTPIIRVLCVFCGFITARHRPARLGKGSGTTRVPRCGQ